MKLLHAIVAAGLFGAITIVATPVSAANPASDDASDSSYDSGWMNGQNSGFGFGPWVFYTSIQNNGEAAGFFVATSGGNPDLNFIATGNPGRAWGTFANEAGTGGDNVQLAAAIRTFTGGTLATGDTFTIRFEHGLIQSGNLNPEFGERTGGWVGFTLRNGTLAQFIDDPLLPFGNINGIWGFGFQGGATNYLVYDNQSPSGRATNVPFTLDGLEVSFTIGANIAADLYDYVAVVKSASNGAVLDTITGITTGSINAFGLYNRNSELNDAFFNSASVTNAAVPCCTGNADKTKPGSVDFSDITSVLANWGAGYGVTGPGDADCDGNVTFADITAVLANFGNVCTLHAQQ